MNAKQIEAGRRVVESINNLYSLWNGAMDASRAGELEDAIDTVEFFLEQSHWQDTNAVMFYAVNDIIVAAYDMRPYDAIAKKLYIETEMEIAAWIQDGTRDAEYLSRRIIPIVVNNVRSEKMRVLS